MISLHLDIFICQSAGVRYQPILLIACHWNRSPVQCEIDKHVKIAAEPTGVFRPQPLRKQLKMLLMIGAT
jgi:hypothetical protein